MDNRFAAIAAAMAEYFDGLYLGDTARLGRVFHEKAHYVCATDQPMVYRGMGDYFAIVEARPSPASRNERRHDRIAEIEFAGHSTAFVRANCAIGERFFTDFLTLVLDAGHWRIISKVFHYEVRQEDWGILDRAAISHGPTGKAALD